jgi:hypothetical protein
MVAISPDRAEAERLTIPRLVVLSKTIALRTGPVNASVKSTSSTVVQQPQQLYQWIIEFFITKFDAQRMVRDAISTKEECCGAVSAALHRME